MDNEGAKPSAKAKSPRKVSFAPTRRSSRTRRAPERHGFDGSGVAGYFAHTLDNHPWSTLSDIDPPSGFKARAVKDPDTLSYGDAMASPNKAQWLEAAQKEISALESKNTWDEVSLSEANGQKVLPGT